MRSFHFSTKRSIFLELQSKIFKMTSSMLEIELHQFLKSEADSKCQKRSKESHPLTLIEMMRSPLFLLLPVGCNCIRFYLHHRF